MDSPSPTYKALIKPKAIIRLDLVHGEDASNSPAEKDPPDPSSLAYSDHSCRICLLDLNEDKPFFKLDCDCKGGLSFSHVECAETWFSLKVSSLCEICGKNVGNVFFARNLPKNYNPSSHLVGDFIQQDLADDYYFNQSLHLDITTLFDSGSYAEGESNNSVISSEVRNSYEEDRNAGGDYGSTENGFSYFFHFHEGYFRLSSFEGMVREDGSGTDYYNGENNDNEDYSGEAIRYSPVGESYEDGTDNFGERRESELPFEEVNWVESHDYVEANDENDYYEYDEDGANFSHGNVDEDENDDAEDEYWDDGFVSNNPVDNELGDVDDYVDDDCSDRDQNSADSEPETYIGLGEALNHHHHHHHYHHHHHHHYHYPSLHQGSPRHASPNLYSHYEFGSGSTGYEEENVPHVDPWSTHDPESFALSEDGEERLQGAESFGGFTEEEYGDVEDEERDHESRDYDYVGDYESEQGDAYDEFQNGDEDADDDVSILNCALQSSSDSDEIGSYLNHGDEDDDEEADDYDINNFDIDGGNNDPDADDLVQLYNRFQFQVHSDDGGDEDGNHDYGIEAPGYAENNQVEGSETEYIDGTHVVEYDDYYDDFTDPDCSNEYDWDDDFDDFDDFGHQSS